MSFQSMKRIIPASLRRLGIDASVSATRVLEESQAALVRLWGEDRASAVEMVTFSEGELLVRVKSSSALAMLRTITVPWMNEANRALGERKVLRIRAKGEG